MSRSRRPIESMTSSPPINRSGVTTRVSSIAVSPRIERKLRRQVSHRPAINSAARRCAKTGMRSAWNAAAPKMASWLGCVRIARRMGRSETLLTAAMISSPSRTEIPVSTTTIPSGPTMNATFAVRPPLSGPTSPPLPNSAYTPEATLTKVRCAAPTSCAAQAAARTARTIRKKEAKSAMLHCGAGRVCVTGIVDFCRLPRTENAALPAVAPQQIAAG